MLVKGTLNKPSFENADMVNRLRDGDAEAWRELAVAVRQRLRNMAASKIPAEVSCRADASDVVQQTLAEANESFAAFSGTNEQELYVWLAAILNHNLNDTVRQHVLAQRRTVRMECRLDDFPGVGAAWEGVCAIDQTSPSMAAARNEAQERLRMAIDNLPPRQRDAVRMRHLEGRPLADIATELDRSPQAAAAVIARGLRELRNVLQVF